MRPVSRRRPAGFTVTEAMVALAVLAIVLGLGMPLMADWVAAGKVGAATQFYADGVALAHGAALSHNSASRLVLLPNSGNGQYDWRVDVCYPSAAVPCNDVSGQWSTTSTAVTDPNDSNSSHGATSVQRAADALPGVTVLQVALTPSNASAVYFTPLGWVDGNVTPRLQRIDLTPARAGAFRPSALVLTLAGLASRCDPTVAAHDSRGCPQ